MSTRPGPSVYDTGETLAYQNNPCPDGEFCADQLELTGIGLPTTSLDPQSPVNMTVTVTNHAGNLSLHDWADDECRQQANQCNRTIFTTSGACAEIHVRPSWSSETVIPPDCFHDAFLTSQTKTLTLQLPAPGVEGQQAVDVWVELSATNRASGIATRGVSFATGGASGCEGDVDCPAGFVCEGGACIPTSSNGGGGGGGQVRELTYLVLAGTAGAVVLSRIVK